jgi:hypothetical protein
LFKSRQDRKSGRAFARQGTLVVAGVLLTVVLSACGGGGDGGAASTPAPAAAPAVPAASGGNAGNGGNGAAAAVDDAPGVTDAPTSSGGGGLSAVPAAAKGSTTLSWLPPTVYDDGTPLKVTGYRIYWGPTEGHYPYSVTLDNPGLTRYVVEELAPATWYFVATALSADGESPPSNVIAMEVL